MDVIFLWKNALSPIAVTVYCLPSYVMDSGITISPLYWWEGLATTSVRPVFTLILIHDSVNLNIDGSDHQGDEKDNSKQVDSFHIYFRLKYYSNGNLNSAAL